MRVGPPPLQAAAAGINDARLISAMSEIPVCGPHRLSMQIPRTSASRSRSGTARSVEATLRRRPSVRAFAPEPLTDAEIGQLLWAAQGIAADWGARTAPSAGALYPR